MRAKFRHASQPTRREVLQTGLAWVAAPVIAGPVRGADGRRGSRRVLVLLHLSGGNDGLNTIIPYADPLYYDLRPRLSRVARDATPISSTAALHPALSALAPVFERGALAIVEGVGCPEPDYSHIGSCRIWGAGMRRLAEGRAADKCPDVGWPSPAPAEHCRGDIGRTLAGIARQIISSTPPEVIFATVGGFDTHTDQLFRHEQVLRELGDGLAAFLRTLELEAVDREALLVAWSEFGRRPAENAMGGTDHGSAGPLLLLGKGVRGGFYGRRPSLSHTDFGNLIPTVDFRDVCGTLAERWFGATADMTVRGAGSLGFL